MSNSYTTTTTTSTTTRSTSRMNTHTQHYHQKSTDPIAHEKPGQESDENMVEKLEHMTLGYGHERDDKAIEDIEDDDNPNVHHKMNAKLFLGLTAMSFLWVGSQIPLYLFGAILPLIYSDIGGADGRYLWMVIGYLVPCAALCPFVGVLSDIFGRRIVAAVGQIFLIVGPIVVSTSDFINVAIGGMVISGLGAGLNELIALAGTSEMVPVKKRSSYVGLVVFTIIPFCPSALWAELIAGASNWRWVGLLIGLWNFVGLVLVALFYRDPIRTQVRPRRELVKEIDFVGGFLSTTGVVLFMLGLQWGANQYTWGSVHVLVPFILGVVLIIAFFVWEIFFAKFPMAPRALFAKDARTMGLILLITFFSGGNFFVMLVFWPTEAYNVYGNGPVNVGIRTLPIGFGIIGGAVISLVLIGVTKGRTKGLLIFWTVIMTAFVGAMSVARVDNLNPTVWPIVTLASIGVGAVIIPCSIIAQIIAPTELIGTITAITLSIRYIGGAIGFTAYYNVFYHKFIPTTMPIGVTIVSEGYTYNVTLLTDLITDVATAQFASAHKLIKDTPNDATTGIVMKDKAFDRTVELLQEQFALAYRWPYWISIAFGVVCIICACGLKDIRKFM